MGEIQLTTEQIEKILIADYNKQLDDLRRFIKILVDVAEDDNKQVKE